MKTISASEISKVISPVCKNLGVKSVEVVGLGSSDALRNDGSLHFVVDGCLYPTRFGKLCEALKKAYPEAHVMRYVEDKMDKFKSACGILHIVYVVVYQSSDS